MIYYLAKNKIDYYPLDSDEFDRRDDYLFRRLVLPILYMDDYYGMDPHNIEIKLIQRVRQYSPHKTMSKSIAAYNEITVASLKKLAKQKNITIPSKARKQEIYDLVFPPSPNLKSSTKKDGTKLKYYIIVGVSDNGEVRIVDLKTDPTKLQEVPDNTSEEGFSLVEYPSSPESGKKGKIKKPKKKAYIPPSPELQDMREDWLTGKTTNKQIEDAVSDLWARGYIEKELGVSPTFEGKDLLSLVNDHVSFLDEELKEEPELEELYPQPTDFVMIYDLKKNMIEYYPLNSGKFEEAEKSKDKVVLYAK